MIYLIGAAVICAVGAAVCAAVFYRTKNYDLQDITGIAFWFLLVFAVIAGGVAIGTEISVNVDETICRRQSQQLERDTKFARYSLWSWDCLTPSADGWVSVDRVIKAEGGER